MRAVIKARDKARAEEQRKSREDKGGLRGSRCVARHVRSLCRSPSPSESGLKDRKSDPL